MTGQDFISFPSLLKFEMVVFFFFLFRMRQPDYTYGSCSTPRGGPGSCKFIYYCHSQEIRRSFDTFLSHACRIDDR